MWCIRHHSWYHYCMHARVSVKSTTWSCYTCAHVRQLTISRMRVMWHPFNDVASLCELATPVSLTTWYSWRDVRPVSTCTARRVHEMRRPSVGRGCITMHACDHWCDVRVHLFMMSVQRHDINARSVRTSRVWLACTEYFQAHSVVDLHVIHVSVHDRGLCSVTWCPSATHRLITTDTHVIIVSRTASLSTHTLVSQNVSITKRLIAVISTTCMTEILPAPLKKDNWAWTICN